MSQEFEEIRYGYLPEGFGKKKEFKKPTPWDEIDAAIKSGLPVQLKVVSEKDGNLYVDLTGGILGICPASEVSPTPLKSHSLFIGTYRNFIIKGYTDRKDKRVGLSRKEAVEKYSKLTWDTIEKGIIVTGTVQHVSNNYVLIDIGGVVAKCPFNEVSYNYINDPGDVVEVGDTIDVKVLYFDKEAQTCTVSIKQLQDDPWETVPMYISRGQRWDGVVRKVVNKGPGKENYIFVEIGFSEYKVEGLASIPSWGIPQVGEKVVVKVLAVEPERHRLRLIILFRGNRKR